MDDDIMFHIRRAVLRSSPITPAALDALLSNPTVTALLDEAFAEGEAALAHGNVHLLSLVGDQAALIDDAREEGEEQGYAKAAEEYLGRLSDEYTRGFRDGRRDQGTALDTVREMLAAENDAIAKQEFAAGYAEGLAYSDAGKGSV